MIFLQSGFLEVALESDNHHMLQIMEHHIFYSEGVHMGMLL